MYIVYTYIHQSHRCLLLKLNSLMTNIDCCGPQGNPQRVHMAKLGGCKTCVQVQRIPACPSMHPGQTGCVHSAYRRHMLNARLTTPTCDSASSLTAIQLQDDGGIVDCNLVQIIIRLANSTMAWIELLLLHSMRNMHSRYFS